MSCLSVELPGLGWLNGQVFEGAKAQQKITSKSCVSSPVLASSCRSPSVSNLQDSDTEIHCGSPLQGFQTPKAGRIGCRCKDSFACSCAEDKNKFLMARTPVALHESKGIDSASGGVVCGSPVRQAAVVNSLRQVSVLKNSPPQENLVSISRLSPCRNSLQTNFSASRLRPVLAVRDENHQSNLWNEISSPAKQEGALGFCQKVRHRIGHPGPVSIRVKWEESEGLPLETPSENGESGNPKSKPQPPSPPLKRKRPPRLDIPQCIGSNAEPLNEEEHPREIHIEGSHYAVSCKKGRREFMEDTHTAALNILGDTKQAFFGVFDGHGGRKAADFAAENIGQNIMNAVVSIAEGKEDHIEQAVRAGYLATDAEFLKQGVSSGTCCVTALIRDGNLVVSNTGDCRAVISRDGQAEALTCDHRVAREDERERIESLGGYVDCRHGVWRVQGVLAVSRGIGDLHMKEWISAEPETRKIEITSDCEFLILASDGLWDKVSNQEAVDLARPFCIEKHADASAPEFFEPGEVMNNNISLPSQARKHSLGRAIDGIHSELQAKARGLNGRSLSVVSDENDPKGSFNELRQLQLSVEGPMAACRKLVELAISRGSLDDVSVLIVELGHFCRRKN